MNRPDGQWRKKEGRGPSAERGWHPLEVLGRNGCCGKGFFRVLPVGLEREFVTSSCDNELRQSTESSAAKSGAFSADFGPIDPDLAAVIAAWLALPADVRRSIIALANLKCDQAPKGVHE